MPSSPPNGVIRKNCVRCSTAFTISLREKQRLTKKFKTYQEPKLCLECRKKKRKFARMVDNIVALHAFAFGFCDTAEKTEVFKFLAQQVVLDASEAGVLDNKKMFRPIGQSEVDGRLAEFVAKNRIELMNCWDVHALVEKHKTADLTEIEGRLRSHIDGINEILAEYFPRSQ